MEISDQQEINKQLFQDYTSKLLLADDKAEDLAFLTEKYPYSQLLQAFYAKTLVNNTDLFDAQLSRAAVYMPDRSVLNAIINHPETLQVLKEPDLIAETEEDKQAEQVSEPEAELNTSDYSREEYDSEDAIPETSSEPLTAEQSGQNLPAAKEEEKEELLIESAASADFLAFEDSPNTLSEGSDDKVEEPDQAIHAEPVNNSDTEKLSKYDDDQLPYTFLWWLHKTRKEHAETYQPYVSFNSNISPKTGNDDLNGQIIEHIFHLQSPFNHSDNPAKTIPFELKRKEEQIIEKFIKEEPQIKPLQPEKVDTENKARKSAEDSNDLVSETLAQIYTDQMLFSKAMDTYRKLSLKFPEKSAYFADQIRELEKKIN
ncbi:MAG: hypothetical protein WBP45_06330 [Daejeonella sp.]